MVFVIQVSIFTIIHLIKFDQSRLLGVPDSILPIASAMGYPKVLIKSSIYINRFGLSFIFYDYNLSQLTTIDNSSLLTQLDTQFLLVHNWIIDKWAQPITYDSLSDVGESWVWFASKNLTPCRMHLNDFLIAQIIAKCHSFPNMYDML